MKGATAEPWLRTTRPPNTTINSSSGNSQNFLRARRKSQNSRRNSMAGPSEQMLHAVGRRPRRIAYDPSRLTRLSKLEPQWVASSHAHDQSGRNYTKNENETHNDGTHDTMQH